MRRLVLIAALCLGVPALAQDQTSADRDFLTGFLEDSLSGAGRTVKIEGFQGALSSRATFERLTISDDKGVWIAIDKGALSWSRTALLTGKVEIDELSADRIELLRLPQGEPTPKVAAKPFSLPELPVSVRIGKLHTGHLALGAPVLGQAAEVSIDGSGNLSGGEGQADLTIDRIDGPAGRIALKGDFANATRKVNLDLQAHEGPNGIAATLLDLPGRPATDLAVKGTGTLDDLSTTLRLATDGSERLAGTIHLTQSPDGSSAFSLNLAGDIAPLLPAEHRTFFGSGVSLQAEGARQTDGRTDLTRLVLTSQGLDLTGRLNLSANYQPLAAALTLRMGLPDGSDLRLPLSGAAQYVNNGALRLRYDAAKGEVWALEGDINGFHNDAARIGSLALDGAGSVQRGGPALVIDGNMAVKAADMRFADPGLAEALGPTLDARTGFRWQAGEPLMLTGLTGKAGAMSLAGDLAISGAGLDLQTDGTLTLDTPDLSRFATLAGRPLKGAADANLTGRLYLLSRAFDLTGTVAGQDISTGIENLDRLLQGKTSIELAARRDEQGLTLSRLALVGPGYSASGMGHMSAEDARIDAQLVASGLKTGIPAADLLLAGTTDLGAAARWTNGAWALTDAKIDGQRLTASLTDPNASGTLTLAARLADIGPFVPGTGIRGPAEAKGPLARTPDGVRMDLTATGPTGISTRVRGTFGKTNDLKATGDMQVAMLNAMLGSRSADGKLRFDLALRGPLDVRSLSGSVVASGLRLSSPAENIAVAFPRLAVDLAGGQARINGTGSPRGSGGIALSGSLGMAAPFDADLKVELTKAQLSNPGLFDTLASGTITVTGPLTGGALVAGDLTLSHTEISVASSGFGSSPIPPIRHLNDPGAVADTRARAGAAVGVTSGQPTSSAAALRLNVTLSAPARIFVRGRGLDAELGGSVRLGGTTAAIVPEGRFELIRGRLSILGKRLKLTDGLVEMMGSFVPYLNFSATADSFGDTTTINLEGLATAPKIHVSSTSGLPEDELLSNLIFGNGFRDLSAFQLVQLANAVATLSGRSSDIVGRIRARLKLDDLDITSDDSGNAALKAGKYLGDTLYSETTIGLDGKAKIELDYDMTKDLTLRGTVGTGGQTGAGVFFNHDY